MRGDASQQAAMFSYLSPDARVPAPHPLRSIKTVADQVLLTLSPTFEAMYSRVGWPQTRLPF